MSEAQWEQIAGFFPQRKGREGFAQKISNRQAFEAVLYRARVGCPWRDVPAWYGHWHTLYMRCKRWVGAGVLERALVARYLERIKAGALDQSMALLDSPAARAHRHAAGAREETGRKPWIVPVAA